MAKLTRKTQKIFAGNATSDQITAFGTAKTTNPVYTTDVDQIQSEIFSQGWTSSLVSDLAPFLQDSNALHYVETYQLAYLMQQGIPEWDANTEYSLNSICKYNDNLYISLQNGNTNHAITQSDYWKVFGDTDSKILNMLQTLYPVGSIYLTINNVCPLSILIPNSNWQLVSSGKALWTGNGSNGNTTIAAGLPNHDHTLTLTQFKRGADGQKQTAPHWGGGDRTDSFDTGANVATTAKASASNSIYGKSTTVQPPAYVVNVFRRIA